MMLASSRPLPRGDKASASSRSLAWISSPQVWSRLSFRSESRFRAKDRTAASTVSGAVPAYAIFLALRVPTRRMTMRASTDRQNL